MEDLALEKDRRIKTRYQVLDDRVWGLRVAGKSVPITWLKDFNSEGASIRIGQFSGIKHGDQIRIELMCFEKPVFVGNALVRWSKICDETISRPVKNLTIGAFLFRYRCG
ncbi:MAG: hypothetical protein KDD38_04715 [Bdellovibrionales bacterium]|nr:hypothetical protein [Bdellovibrionales bacterium]